MYIGPVSSSDSLRNWRRFAEDDGIFPRGSSGGDGSPLEAIAVYRGKGTEVVRGRLREAAAEE